MSHGNPVGHSDGVETTRHPATLFDAQSRDIGLGIQSGVAGRAIIAC